MDFFGTLLDSVVSFAQSTGFAQIQPLSLVMIVVSFVLLYLAIGRGFEPLLLVPIAFGMLLVNLPGSTIMNPPTSPEAHDGGLLYYLFMGDELGVFPPLIFLGVGALIDFGPVIANPKSLILGAAAQFGIFVALIGALLFGFSLKEAAAIATIGGADGPTAIFTATKLAKDLLPTIAVAAYSYMSLVPIIQPPIMRLLTTEKERAIKMEQLREVSKMEKILFPIIVTVLVVFIVPDCAALIGMLMLGNLFRECGVTERLAKTAADSLMYIITIFIGVTVGASTRAESFLAPRTLGVIFLGLVAFAFSTAMGVLIGKLMCKLTHGKINPLIGAAGVSAVPMAARVVQKVGQEENPDNYLLMHAMGANVAGVIGTAVVAGFFISYFS